MKSPVPTVEHIIDFGQVTVGLTLLYDASAPVLFIAIIKRILKKDFKGSMYSSIPVLNSNGISDPKLEIETLFVDLIFFIESCK